MAPKEVEYTPQQAVTQYPPPQLLDHLTIAQRNQVIGVSRGGGERRSFADRPLAVGTKEKKGKRNGQLLH